MASSATEPRVNSASLRVSAPSTALSSKTPRIPHPYSSTILNDHGLVKAALRLVEMSRELVEHRHELDGKREDDCRILLDPNVREGLQVAQLQGHGLCGHQGGGIHQF